ncbi:MAG: FkbM family methyltransferase [Hyphomicrobiaceae bacterium]
MPTATTATGTEPPIGAYRPGLWPGTMMALSHMLGRGPISKRIGTGLRWLADPKPDTCYDVEVLGSFMRLRPVGNATEKHLTFMPQLFDPAELAAIESTLEPGSVFIDVGANVGAYTLFAAARSNRECIVIAVEPHPVALQRLRFNIAANEYAHVRVEALALSDKPGTATLKIVDSNIGQTSVVQGSGDTAATAYEVQTDTLMGLCRRNGLSRLDALKLDIEGHEPPVLLAFFAEAPAAMWPKVLVLEANGGLESSGLARKLADMGYSGKPTPQRNIIFRRSI